MFKLINQPAVCFFFDFEITQFFLFYLIYDQSFNVVVNFCFIIYIYIYIYQICSIYYLFHISFAFLFEDSIVHICPIDQVNPCIRRKFRQNSVEFFI